VKITKQLLKQIIREEIDSVLEVEMDTRQVEEGGGRTTLLGMKYERRVAQADAGEIKVSDAVVKNWRDIVKRERRKYLRQQRQD